MSKEKHKSEKINSVVNENDRNLNLHEIKKQTGAGNGHKKSHNTNEEVKNVTETNQMAHKSEQIHSVVHENDRNLNLHEIKKQTGAGNGHKHHNNPTNNSNTENSTNEKINKSEQIHSVVHENDRNLNLHEIKKQTGAGNGDKHSNLKKKAPAKTVSKENPKFKSEQIHSVVHENDRNLNLHEIKKQTGAGNGHKHK